ncbi:hypothetical protein Tco_1045275 [Tanacetum coccineum]|uniref:Uncharacterized protein n=1 Tax=Tanacetum coccineum TaxID=301880 RepID=A0ABQ5GT69_9ASTR
MAPRGRPTRLNPDATPTPVTPAPNAPTTTTVTEGYNFKALIDQGVCCCKWLEAEARQGNIGVMPDMILGSVKASKSKTLQEVIRVYNSLMEGSDHAYAERQARKGKEVNDLPLNQS